MPLPRLRHPFRLLAVGVLLLASVGVIGCVHVSGGTWMISNAPTPEGWPELTPVGEVTLRTYPTYRAATVSGGELGDDDMSPMFMTLFDHIQRNDIAMTAPVDMGYAGGDEVRMASMAFLYRTRDLGPTGRDGVVRIDDAEAATFASIGVRGDYTTRNFEAGLEQVRVWLEANADRWATTGPPRYLGYNGPFIPGFMKYGEVQVPVERRTATVAR